MTHQLNERSKQENLSKAESARSDATLAVRGLSVHFGGFQALNSVSLSVPKGQRRAIIGPNGAGKTTLLKTISGALSPSHGEVYLFNEEVTGLPEYERSRRGVARTYQITNLFKDLTVLENVSLTILGKRATKWVFLRPFNVYGDVREQALSHLARVGLEKRADHQVTNLSYGEQRQLELALALAGDPQLLLLDEPAAGLSPGEREMMRLLVGKIPSATTIVMIEHNMDLVLAFADWITVLDHGRVVAEGTPDGIRNNEDVKRVYLGKL